MIEQPRERFDIIIVIDKDVCHLLMETVFASYPPPPTLNLLRNIFFEC